MQVAKRNSSTTKQDYEQACGEDEEHPGQPLNATGNIFGLVNGMVGGGASLILPQMGVQTGYINIVLVCLFTGYICYYTADLIALHLGKGRSAKEQILSHFKYDYKYMRVYSFIIWFSFVPVLLAYFRVTCLQVEGLMGYYSPWVGPGVSILFIIAIIVIRTLHLGQQTLALGILSIIIYVMFIIWALATAPSGPHTVPATGPSVAFAAVMINAYQTQDFLTPNLIRNPNKSQYRSVVKWTYILGILIYTFIAYGSFAIVNRKSFVKMPEVINDYFGVGQWQISVIEIVYLIQMVTSYPAFLITSKYEFFSMLKMNFKKAVTWQDVTYIVFAIFISYMFYTTGVRLQVICSINGAIIGFSYVVLIPVWVHLKCVWYDRASGFIEGDEEWNSQIVSNVCECDVRYRTKWTLYLQTSFLVAMVIVYLALIVFTLMTLAPTPPHPFQQTHTQN